MLELKPKDKKRLLKSIQISDNCWNWTGTTQQGYGVFSITNEDGTRNHYKVHRIVYELLRGEIPKGLVIDHLKEFCKGNRACCNPWHLEPVTNAENIRRGDVGKKERERTECPHGHTYDELNTIYTTTKSGKIKRGCRICRNAFHARKRGNLEYAKELIEGTKIPTDPKKREACPKGHLYDEDNTIHRKGGGRGCRTCRNSSGIKLRDKVKNGEHIPSHTTTQCKRGHLRTPENTAPSGRCKQCQLDWRRNKDAKLKSEKEDSGTKNLREG